MYGTPRAGLNSPAPEGLTDFFELFTKGRLTVGEGPPYKPHTGGAVVTNNQQRLTVFTSFDGLLGHLAAMPGRRSCCLFSSPRAYAV